MRSVNSGTLIPFAAVGGHLLRNNIAHISSDPAYFNEQSVDVRKRLDASFNSALEPLGRIRAREMYRRLDGCQHVLGPVFGLAGKDGDLRLTSLSFTNIAGDFGRADDFMAASFL